VGRRLAARRALGVTSPILYWRRSLVPRPVRALRARLRAITQAVDDTRADVAALRGQLAVESARTHEILLALRDREAEQRERLQALRGSTNYDLAFTDPEPLVSIVIPTYDNYRLLAERSVPSIQAQTYQRLEIIIIGDAAPEEAREIVESINDSRITYRNRSYRGPYPEHPRARWHVAGVPPYDEATSIAKGRWIAHLPTTTRTAPTIWRCSSKLHAATD
jgi:hypothetical protein